MHAENGGVIDVLVQEALRKGQKAPKYHALTRPPRAEGEATGRAIALAEMAGVPIYIVHLSSADALEKVREARDMGLPAYAETCPQYLFLSLRQLRGARLRRRQVRDVAAAAREVAPGRAVEGAGEERPAGDLDRPLPLLHERAEGAGQGRLQQDPQRRAGHRDAPDARPQRRRPRRDASASIASSSSARPRRRRCSACSRARERSPSAATPTSSSSIPNDEADARRQDAAHARRLQPLRRHRRRRRAERS